MKTTWKQKKLWLLSLASLLMVSALNGCAVPEGDSLPAPTQESDLYSAAEATANTDEEVPPMDAENNIWNVMDFGATGDGRTDDYTALQRGVNTVMRAGGGTLYFPAGNYRTSQTLRITMAGEAPLTLAADPSGGASLVSSADIEGSTVYINHPYVTVSGITIVHNATADSVAMVLMSDHALLVNSTIKVASGNDQPLLQVYGSYNTIKASGFNYCSDTPHIIEFSKKAGIRATGNVLEDCYFGGSHDYCVLVTTEEEDACQENLTIQRNVFLLSAIGQVELRAVKNCTINDNMLDAGQVSIVLDPMKAGITNVSITNNYCGASGGGIQTRSNFGGTAKNIIVSANYFWTANSIDLVSDKYTDFTITDNYFVLTGGIAIQMKNAIHAYIEGNVVAPVGGEGGLKIDDVDDNTVIQYNSFGNVWVPEWNERFAEWN